MLAHLPRLLVLWRIIAGYRLDTLIPADAPVPLGRTPGAVAGAAAPGLVVSHPDAGHLR